MNKITDNRPPFAMLEGKTPESLFGNIPTPCYVIDEAGLRKNCEILASVIKKTECSILLAQKAFSNYDFYPLLSQYLSGTEASGLFEARLGAEKMPDKEVHVFCAAYKNKEFDELMNYADHIVFNSPGQLKKFGAKAKHSGKSIGLRINPECSTQKEHEIYDPCAAGSRLGTTRMQWEREMNDELIGLLDGLHFHTLCEQNSDALRKTLDAVNKKFGDILPGMKWLNMGGGHHITRADYNMPLLEQCIEEAKTKWDVKVYLEPGEACALNAGYLVCRVLDIVQNDSYRIAILDTSAACHMPDVIEMPYTPPLYGAENAGSQERTNNSAFLYRLAGPTCLAGDIIGDYNFPRELHENDILIFGDMAIYSTCKNNTFNGIPFPDIWKRNLSGQLVKLTNFDYHDFRKKLGSS